MFPIKLQQISGVLDLSVMEWGLIISRRPQAEVGRGTVNVPDNNSKGRTGSWKKRDA